MRDGVNCEKLGWGLWFFDGHDTEFGAKREQLRNELMKIKELVIHGKQRRLGF